MRVDTDVQLLSEEQARMLYEVEPRAKMLAELVWLNGTSIGE